MEGMHNRKLFDLLVSWVLAYFVIIGALLLVCVAVTIAMMIGASWTVTVAAALLAAAPAVALPFSARAAKWLLLLAYSGLPPPLCGWRSGRSPAQRRRRWSRAWSWRSPPCWWSGCAWPGETTARPGSTEEGGVLTHSAALHGMPCTLR